ncbi:MAG: sulfotransferase family protein, partial [Acidiferrobacterales bacterium]
IRDPAKVLPSMYDKWPDFMVEETGYAEQRELFERITKAYSAPPVIDADDLVNRPDATVRAYCEAVDIPFVPKALSWAHGERKEVSWYDNGNWHGNLKASTGLKRQKNNYLDVDTNEHLWQTYEICLPHYQALCKYRLGSGK